MSSAEEQAKRNAQYASQTARMVRGLCVSVDAASGMGVFNINGGEQMMPLIGTPSIGWEAWILYVGPQPFCVGPVWRSPWGVVAEAPASGRVAVTGDDGRAYPNLPYSSPLELTVGDRVVMDWDSQTVIMEPAAETVDGDTSGPQQPPQGPQTRTFFPTGSGSYGSRWFTDQVYSSDSNLGLFFYAGIASTIPDDATILSVVIHLEASQVSGGDPTFGLHTLADKSSAPTVTSAIAVAPGSGDRELPPAFGDALKTGAALGVGTNHGGYHIYLPANVANCGALTITYQV